MSRSRLDEIVEEVLSCWYSRSSPQMPPKTVTFSRDLVASLMATSNEKAFRHGVEQSDNINGPGSIPFLRREWDWNVQPAQAGEPHDNDPAYKKGCWYYRDGMPFPDRRKGERRRGLGVEEHIAQFGGLGVIYRTRPNVWPWYQDRRSGKDRRK